MSAHAIQELRCDAIDFSPSVTQAARRAHFHDEELDDLVASIREHGVLQPIIVRYAPGSKVIRAYELVAGERRLRASRLAERETIPAVVRDFTTEQVLEVQLIENLQRKDVHPMEEAEGYQELMKYGHDAEELAARLGKSKGYVYGRLKLLALCDKARAAFYAGEISASVAVLVARIPSEKLQQELLEEIRPLDDHEGAMPFRGVAQLVQTKFMLRLNGKAFPKDHPEVNGAAGPCTVCPKRTGNQAELFADVPSADVCTDPPCFQAKVKAWAAVRIREAKAAGRKVIAGKQAKKAWPQKYGGPQGYARVDESTYHAGKSRKISTIVGKAAERILLENPHTGDLVEVVPRAVLKAALREKADTKADDRYRRQQRAAERALKVERTYRAELYKALRPQLPPAGLRLIATRILSRMENEVHKALARVIGLEVPAKKQSWGSSYRDYRGALDKHLKGLPEKQLAAFVNDAIYAAELTVYGGYSKPKPSALLEEAAAAVPDVDAKAIRRAAQAKHTPKKKKAKKTARKKPARKKAKKVKK